MQIKNIDNLGMKKVLDKIWTNFGKNKVLDMLNNLNLIQ